MFSKKLALSAVTLSLLATSSMANVGQTHHGESLSHALEASDVSVSFRGRYETVDQENMSLGADGVTLKSRLSVATGRFHSFSMGVEVDNVFAILDDYNDTTNGLTKYPVIADPENTDINLAYIKYSTSNFRTVVGRQRIEHGDHRFVGNSGWRQNEQTFDGLRVQYKNSGFELDYSYVSNINNTLGEDDKGDFHLANLSYSLNKSNVLSLYGYMLDFEDTPWRSSSTYGVSYAGKFGGLIINAGAAQQSDNAENMTAYSATYLNAELGYKFPLGDFTVLGGYELLGSDNGVSFQTPLATGHKFQGWADQFTQTPGTGLEDIYLTLTGKMFVFDLEVGYHDYVSDADGKDMGNEVNALIGYKINDNYHALIKYASYTAGSVDYGKTDTDKVWVQFSASF